MKVKVSETEKGFSKNVIFARAIVPVCTPSRGSCGESCTDGKPGILHAQTMGEDSRMCKVFSELYKKSAKLCKNGRFLFR